MFIVRFLGIFVLDNLKFIIIGSMLCVGTYVIIFFCVTYITCVCLYDLSSILVICMLLCVMWRIDSAFRYFSICIMIEFMAAFVVSDLSMVNILWY